MSNAFSESFLLDALARSEVVVLPNRAAARTLRSAFDDRQIGAGRLAWESPKVLTWTRRGHARRRVVTLAHDGA